jgi:hypothetical protein
MSKSEMLLPPVHPGEILREDFMKPLNLTVNCTYPLLALVKSCTSAGGLQRRLPCDLLGTSVRMLSFG